MADYFFQSADSFDFPESSAREVINIIEGKFPEWWLKKHDLTDDDIEQLLSGDEEAISEFLEGGYDVYEMSQSHAEYSDGQLYVATEDQANLGFIAQALADVMKKDGINKIITLTGANTCSRPRAGEFGGIAIAVAPGEYISQDTLSLARQLGDKLVEKLNLSTVPANKQNERIMAIMEEKFANLGFGGKPLPGGAGCDYSKGDYDDAPAYSLTYRHAPTDEFLEKLEALGLNGDAMHDISHSRGYALEDAMDEYAKKGKIEAKIMKQTRMFYEGDHFIWKKAGFFLNSALASLGVSGKAENAVKKSFQTILDDKINEQSVSTRLRVMMLPEKLDCSIMIWRGEDTDNPGCKLECDMGAGFELEAKDGQFDMEEFSQKLDNLMEDVFPNLNNDAGPRPRR